MKNTSSGFTLFIAFSFISHILAAIFLMIYAQNYEVKQKELEEFKKMEELAKKEEELKKDIEEILHEIVEEKDEKKKEEIIEELKEKVWEELEEKKEELIADKKELDEEQYQEELVKETLKALDEIKKDELEEEKKKELIEELVLKDLPEVDKKVAEELNNKTVEELEKEAIKEALNDLKKIAEEEIKPVLEMNKDGFHKKIEDLIKQLADTTKNDDKQSLQEEMKKILEKTDEIIGKSEEADKKFAEESEAFKKDQLEIALEVFKDKEKEVAEKKEAVLEAFKKISEDDTNKTSKPSEIKLPETKKDWDVLIKETGEAIKSGENKKPENQTIATKPLEELAKSDAEKNIAEKNLKNVLKEEIGEAKKASEEVKQITTSENSKKQIVEVQKELEAAENKSNSTQANEVKQAAETVQGIKQTIPEIAKGTFKKEEGNNQNDPLAKALDSFKDSEKAVENKKEEVLDIMKKIASEEKKANPDQEISKSVKPPVTNQEWEKLINETKAVAKSNENKSPEQKSPLTKQLESLVQKESDKTKAEEKLKTVLKEEIKDVKKASDEFSKASISEEAKKQVGEVKKDIASAENKSVSNNSKEVKEAAETIQNVKSKLPELAKESVKNNEVANQKEPLAKALENYKDKEKAVEKKKEEVLDVIKKLASEEKSKEPSKENHKAVKAPETEKEWDKLIKESKEVAKNNDSKKQEIQPPLTKPLEALAQKDAEKEKAEVELKQVLKDEIDKAKKASDQVEKVAKSEEGKKQISEVKKKIDTAESKSTSEEPKEFKNAAESVEAIKKAIPEIGANEKSKSEKVANETPKTEKSNKATAPTKNSKDASELKADLGATKELLEKAIGQLTELKTGNEPEETKKTDKIENQVAKAELLLKELSLPKSTDSENPITPDQLKEPKENISKAQSNIEELKVEVSIKENEIKKEIANLKKNLTDKEKKEFKEELGNLDSEEKKITEQKSLDIKVEALNNAESQIDEMKSTVNESRKKSLAKNQEQREKIKNLADEISKGLEDTDSKRSKEELVNEVINQAMETMTEEKSEKFEKFLAENESENVSKEVESFKSEAKDSIEQAIQEKSAGKDGDKSDEPSTSDEDEAEANGEEGEESGSEEDGEKSKSKGKGKGAKGKGKGKGEAKDGEEDSALAKALASNMISKDKAGQEGQKEGEGQGEKEKSNSKGNGNGQKLDGNTGKTPLEIAQNILLRTSKTFKKAIVTAEDEKRIFTENINFESIRVPPVIKFAKPTANGLPLEAREHSAEVFSGATKVNASFKEKQKNPERPRIKHEKFTKGNFTPVPYLKNKPLIDGKSDDWQLDKGWMKSDKRISMGWRSDGLYFFATIRDRTDIFEKAPMEEMFATWWRFDCVELWIDMQNSKSDDTNKFDCQQFTFWPALKNIRNSPEIYEILWGKRAVKASFKERKQIMVSDSQTYVASVEHADQRGYDMEIFIPHERLSNHDYFKGGQVAGFLYIINHGNLVEDSSLEFYKEGYEGYSGHPSSWGNIQFLGTDAKIEQINKDRKIVKERVVEASTNLSLQVNDSDSNQNPNIIDKVTLRVKNENDFDGNKSENTDWEDILLTETGKNTGVFTGIITLTVGASKPGDNSLCAHAGDTLNAYYNDHIQIAGEYDEKMHVKIKVIAPVQNITGRNQN